MTSQNKKGLTGENIDEETAKNKAKQFVGEDKIEEITSNGKSENTDIIAYDFTVKLKMIKKIRHIFQFQKRVDMWYL